MSWLSRIINPSTWRGPRKHGDTWFYPLTRPDTWKNHDYLANFEEIPELNAVISLIARSFSNGRIVAVNQKLEEVTTPYDNLIKNPNWFQAQKEFMRQTKLFNCIYGNEFINGFIPVGFDWTRSKALFTLPPNLVCSEYTDTTPFFLHSERPKGVKYILKDKGYEKELDADTIIHLNDNRVNIKSTTDKKLLQGESKQCSLRAPINNIRAAYESRGIIIVNRGAQGILSNASKDGIGAMLPMDPIEKKRVQDEYRGYGTLAGQDMVIISDNDLRWQQMTINPKNLGLFEEIEQDFFKICDGYGAPIDLFASTKGSTFENQKQAEKGLYVRTVIPEANEWIYALNQKFFPDGKIKWVVKYNHLDVFQEDRKLHAEALDKMVTALSKAFQDQAISIEQYRSELIKYGLTE